MVTFETPRPNLDTPEHPRGTPSWITAYPSQRQIDGRPPINQPPTIEKLPIGGRQPGERGLTGQP